MDNADKSSEGKTKNITLGLILSWLIGTLLVIIGIGLIVSSPAGGFAVLLGGLIMFPPVNDFFRKKSNFHLSGGVRFVIAIILFGVGIAMTTGKAVEVAQQNNVVNKGSTTASSATNINSSSPAQTDELELLSYSCTKEYGYFKVTGQVKNISGKSMESVQAVGTLYTKDGEFVKSDTALIEYNPILAGQTSPFEVITTDNPAATKCQVEFKRFWGGTISTKRDDQ